jgi:hypothetical protein
MDDVLIERVAAEYVAETLVYLRRTKHVYQPGNASAVVVAWKKSTFGMFMAYRQGLGVREPTSISFLLYQLWIESGSPVDQFIDGLFARVLNRLTR